MRTVFILLFSLIFIFSCKEKNESASAPQNVESTSSMSPDIDIETAKQMIINSSEIILLDVRTPEEIALGKIEKAIEIDFTAQDFSEKVAALDKNKEYIVYCAAGGRSAKAVKLMKDSGFEKVYNLKDGYAGWSKEQQ